MRIRVRPESADHPELMKMLKFRVGQMVTILRANNIFLNDNIVKIWIKQYGNDRFFPKIEFDYRGYELQYDIDDNGEIIETHFKQFLNEPTGNKRVDIKKEAAHPLLISIDDLLNSPSDVI